MANLDKMLRYILPAYLIVFFATTVFWRSYLVRKKTGINPVILSKRDDVYGFIEKSSGLTVTASIFVIMVYSMSKGWYQYLAPIFWLQELLMACIGLMLLLISLVWILIAQNQMDKSWRMGIDLTAKTELVQRGFYHFSRNPIFLGVQVNLLGFFLVLPNAVTLTILIVGDILIQIQVRLEEDYLVQIHGKRYREYCQSVRRWF